MIKAETLKELAEVSAYGAKHPYFVQGGGGNTSVKQDEYMVVTGSGVSLENVTEERGFVVVQTETGQVIEPENGRASIEACVHRLLHRVVLHTHPIPVIALASTINKEALCQDLFPEAAYAWVDYAKPGQDLADEVKSVLENKGESLGAVATLFLQNHGLFISSDSVARCVELQGEVIKRLETFFAEKQASVEIPESQFLTPDHAVYCALPEVKEKHEKAAQETEFAVKTALSMIQAKGQKPHWLTAQQVAAILDMPEEKYRQSLESHSLTSSFPCEGSESGF